jgi:hypothetical protein
MSLTSQRCFLTSLPLSVSEFSEIHPSSPFLFFTKWFSASKRKEVRRPACAAPKVTYLLADIKRTTFITESWNSDNIRRYKTVISDRRSSCIEKQTKLGGRLQFSLSLSEPFPIFSNLFHFNVWNPQFNVTVTQNYYWGSITKLCSLLSDLWWADPSRWPWILVFRHSQCKLAQLMRKVNFTLRVPWRRRGSGGVDPRDSKPGVTMLLCSFDAPMRDAVTRWIGMSVRCGPFVVSH